MRTSIALLVVAATWLAGSTNQAHRLAPRSQPRPRRPALTTTAPVLTGAAVALLLGGAAGCLLGLATAVATATAAHRLPARAAAQLDRRRLADLPLVLDLVAACLESGAPLADALDAAAAAAGPPLREELRAVVRAHRLGLPPATAWLPFGDPARPARLRAMAATLCRAEEAGASPVGALTALAREARAAAKADGEAAARRAGVRALFPLACCHLPAFVLLGVVPLVAGLAGHLAR